ncbi:glycosyltransferase [Prevotella sp. kh1p2]|uniref:glycosyltransferase n=1 Tax=Prevotella sp. kh1p2 TaxID=1761883 RepID=UPI0008D6DDAC|nr:glycosyltransferase [Prevotella sp. kh1p2]SET10936.1 Glycosyltransferase involved in cell wall bisynthesis [Prevotella sp. kh1p2]SNU11837.1 Glycosyltransferase involved in cell wall bisynthesis [Prevotellaceae bacterium KH2P17]
MKKRIFIAMHYMEIGGAEISLIGLLQSLDYSRYDVDLFLYSHRGELMSFIPKEVNILEEVSEYTQIERPLKNVFLDGHLRIFFARLKAKYHFWRYARKKHPKDGSAILQFVANSIVHVLPNLYQLGEYDMAISFLTPHNIVFDKVKAKHKVCWIHTDYSQIDVNVNMELPVWQCYEHIISISESVTKSFVDKFPILADKIVLIKNILSAEFVRRRSILISEDEIRVEIPRMKEGFNLLSVGRFCEAKNYDNIPEICQILNNSGYRIKWYILGYGNDKIIRKKIKEFKMENSVIILGKRANPYPYIRVCDIYVQPSRYEGNSVTVREAQILGKLVVVTNYPTARNQILNGVDGIIVPMSNQECAKGIANFINDVPLQNRIREYLVKHDFGNQEEINKLYSLG